MSAWHAPQCAHSAAAPKSLRWLKTGRCGQPVAACAAHACTSASLTRGSEPPSALRSSRTPPQAQSTTPRRQSRRRVKQTGQGTGSSPDASGAPHSSCSSAAAAAAASSAATAASYSASAAASAQMEIRDEGVSQRECKTEARSVAGPKTSWSRMLPAMLSGGWGLSRAFVAQLVRQRRLEAGQQRVRLSGSQRRLLKMSAATRIRQRCCFWSRLCAACQRFTRAPGRRARCLRLRLASSTPGGATREEKRRGEQRSVRQRLRAALQPRPAAATHPQRVFCRHVRVGSAARRPGGVRPGCCGRRELLAPRARDTAAGAARRRARARTRTVGAQAALQLVGNQLPQVRPDCGGICAGRAPAGSGARAERGQHRRAAVAHARQAGLTQLRRGRASARQASAGAVRRAARLPASAEARRKAQPRLLLHALELRLALGAR